MSELVERLVAAMNRHDAGAVAALFASDYRSEQPLHPRRGFGGSQQVRANWTSVFAGVPNFRAEVVTASESDGNLWLEMRWSGTHPDRSAFLMCGVIVLGVRDGQIAWGAPLHGTGR